MKPDVRRMLPGAALALMLAPILALPGCQEAKRQPAQGGTAGGEILEASVSDEMLPTDRVRSQAPLAPRTEASKGARQSGEDDAGDEAGAAEEEVSGEGPAPAAEPPPPPTPDGE